VYQKPFEAYRGSGNAFSTTRGPGIREFRSFADAVKVRCHSQITAFFNETVEFLTQESKTSLLDQGYLSTA
jgi:hypothetical protein